MSGILRRFSAIICALCISYSAFSAGNNSYFEPLDPDILPSSEVSNLYQDADGFLWISTYWGIVRYDGYRGVPYSIYSDYEDILRGGFISAVKIMTEICTLVLKRDFLFWMS